MGAPIVYFEIAGPEGENLREFYTTVFGWNIDEADRIDPTATGGLKAIPFNEA
jgi:predicted enzyme related to lactoylglutathione lyase